MKHRFQRVRRPLLCCLLVTLSIACGGEPTTERRAPRDVILIVVDSLRADRLGAYGYEKGTSPNLDRLAEDSMVFDRAYSTAPWTLPSIATLMTGMHPYALGIRAKDVRIDSSNLTLPELFRDAGFSTGAIVSHVYLQPKWGATESFEHIDTEEVRGHQHVSSPAVTRKAIEFLEQHPDDRLFLLLHYFDPHYAYVDHENSPVPPGAERVTSHMTIKELRGMARDITDAERSRLDDIYDSEVRFTDRHIGAFLDALKAAGRYDDALIVFVADHGEALAERHTRFIGHVLSLATAVLRVPLFVKLPGNSQRGRVEAMVSSIDIMPTIAKEAGLEIPADVEVQGAPFDWTFPEPNRRTVFGETGKWAAHQTVVDRDGRWKLVHKRLAKVFALYDLDDDPLERHDVSKEFPIEFERLKGELRSWNEELERARESRTPTGEAPALDAQDEDALRAMGYIE